MRETIYIRPRDRTYVPTHPDAGLDGRIEIHRFKAINALGKSLPKKAVVHHFYPTDEIVICQDMKYHLLLHTRQRAFEETGNPNKRRCLHCQQWDNLENLIGDKWSHYFHRTCHNEDAKRYRQRKKEKGT